MNYQQFSDNLSLILQILSFELLIKDSTNNTILNELQNQDSNYLQKIIEQNEQILTLLRKEDNNARKVREKN